MRINRLGLVEYPEAYQAMVQFTDQRGPHTEDAIWFVEHPPVFTLGMNADPIHLLAPADITVARTDRGGQVTYHGPGQLMVYVLVDLRRARLGVRDLVTALESAVIAAIAPYAILGHARPRAPGVYVGEAKLASLGLRVRRGCSYHGLALNVNGDLEPFSRINPCGSPGLAMVNLRSLGGPADLASAMDALEIPLRKALGVAALPR